MAKPNLKPASERAQKTQAIEVSLPEHRAGQRVDLGVCVKQVVLTLAVPLGQN